jgi:hypothetical protein
MSKAVQKINSTNIHRYGGERCCQLKLLPASNAALGGSKDMRRDGAEVLLQSRNVSEPSYPKAAPHRGGLP